MTRNAQPVLTMHGLSVEAAIRAVENLLAAGVPEHINVLMAYRPVTPALTRPTAPGRPCAHCGHRVRNPHPVDGDQRRPVCSSPGGMNCLDLVTIHKHRMPCPACTALAPERE